MDQQSPDWCEVKLNNGGLLVDLTIEVAAFVSRSAKCVKHHIQDSFGKFG